jgi:hypothetical protein
MAREERDSDAAAASRSLRCGIKVPGNREFEVGF